MVNQQKLDPWERQSTESTQAFAAFSHYRDLGSSRSLRSVSRDIGKSLSLIARWSLKHEWIDRTAHWDAEIDRKNRDKQLNEISKMAERHARSAQAGMSIATQLVGELISRIRNDKFINAVDDNGNYVIPNNELIQLALNATRIIDPLAKVERTARGVPEAWIMVSQMEDKQLEAFILALLHERERAGFGTGASGDEEAGLENAIADLEENSTESLTALDASQGTSD